MSDAIQLNWNCLEQLIPLCLEYKELHSNGEKPEIKQIINDLAHSLGIDNVDQYALDHFGNAMEEGLGTVFSQEDSKALSVVFIAMCQPVMTLVSQYAKGGIEARNFLESLNAICSDSTEALLPILQNSLGIPPEAAEYLSEVLGPRLISVYCFAGAFKIYKKASQDAQLAHERRLQIEQMTNETINRLKAERAEMDQLVDSYLLDKLLPVNTALCAMDAALIESDNDGFIVANAELWTLFGRTSQYSNSSEFEELMLSNEAFKL